MKISFDNENAIASLSLADWASPVVAYLGRYFDFDVSEGMLRLDYSHLSDEVVRDDSAWIWDSQTARQRFVSNFEDAASMGQMELALLTLGHGSTGISNSSSILDHNAYQAAEKSFRKDMLLGGSKALREVVLAEITPFETWVGWLLDRDSYDRSRFLDDQEIMAALVARTAEHECIHGLKLVSPRHDQNNWAFEQLVKQHWQQVRNYLDIHVGMSTGHSYNGLPDLVISLFASSPTVQASRWACEQVLNRSSPSAFPRLIKHCHALMADDVRSLLQRWRTQAKTDKKDDFKGCVAEACSTLATLLAGSMPSDLALAAAWHEFGQPVRQAQQLIAASLRELPSGTWDQGGLWSQLGPAAAKLGGKIYTTK